MSNLHRLNAIQNELRDALSLSQEDYRLEVERSEIGARFIGMQLRSVFQPIPDVREGYLLGKPAGAETWVQSGDLMPAVA